MSRNVSDSLTIPYKTDHRGACFPFHDGSASLCVVCRHCHTVLRLMCSLSGKAHAKTLQTVAYSIGA